MNTTTLATRPGSPLRFEFDVWSTTATLVVTDPAALEIGLSELHDELAAIDATCSRFRVDSEISRLLARPGRWMTVSPTLNAALTHAIRIAAATDYLVDPTVAAAVIALGYDQDISGVVSRSACDAITLATSTAAARSAPGAWRLGHDPDTAQLLIPPGVGIDLGATAKALAADRAAARIARITGGGVLVNLGGDIAVAGQAPAGGWRISVADDHRSGAAHQVVSITSGGLATSSTVNRRWHTASGWAHHIIDPRTGLNPEPLWRTVAVAAASCVDANAASTAAIVLGRTAPQWLADQRLPALLVDTGGAISTVRDWPSQAPT